jgi:DNA-binding NtrC family response regulator
VAAIKDGAFDYLAKHFSVDRLRVAVDRGLRQRELERENRNLRDQLQGTLGFENIIGRSPAMTQVFVRELQNVVERACALAEGDLVKPSDLPDYLLQGAGLRGPAAATSSGPALPSTADLALKDAKEKWMRVLEASYLRDLLARHGGNISAAAKAAGIDRKTFHRRSTSTRSAVDRAIAGAAKPHEGLRGPNEPRAARRQRVVFVRLSAWHQRCCSGSSRS